MGGVTSSDKREPSETPRTEDLALNLQPPFTDRRRHGQENVHGRGLGFIPLLLISDAPRMNYPWTTCRHDCR